ncbi:MAG TPA: hydroxymethylbilane synthase [Gemmatimonadaceae bacterium]|nr:hydroxymethylbilane synthase [Gemmatimonadaceae bacterium]
MSGRTIRIATRSSELALRQARIVEAALEERGFACELVTFKTVGDKKLDEPLSAIGAKGLFTHELEVALSKGKVDCCVHSLKDLPTESPEGLEIGAILAREDPRDVLVVNPVTQADDLMSLPAGSRVGTSSLRRRAQLLAFRPDLEVVELRGNVPTRLRKVDQGQVHAAILAAAGLIRLNAQQHIKQFLEPPGWLPAAGQGAIAVQIRSDDDEMREQLRPLNHGPTDIAVRAERSFLSALEGGCQVPIGALAVADAGGSLMLFGYVSDVFGRDPVRGSWPVDVNAPEEAGLALAADLRTRGATSLLMELRNSQQLISPQPE